MDDGAIQQLGHKGFVLCTDGFKEQEVELLICILQKKYKVDCGKYPVKTKKAEIQYRIRIYVNGHDTFRNIVEPYILPCFEYKINPI